MPAPEYIIDLELEPEERWTEVGESFSRELRRILPRTRRELLAEAGEYARFIERMADAAAGGLVRIFGEHEYVRELEGLAWAAGVSVEDLFLVNLVYDLSSHAGAGMLGCTGFVHGGPASPLIARCMDWSLPRGIGALSTVFRFRWGSREVISVGFPGLTGIISGLSSEGVAITVNQRYPDELRMPGLALPTLWLVRSVLENATSYRSARRLLSQQAALAPAFYLVAGSANGEACLVQSKGDDDFVITVGAGCVQGVANDTVEAEEGDSDDRYAAITRRTEYMTEADVYAAKAALGRYPVTNADTVHQMVIVPADGQLHLRCPHRGERAYTVYEVTE